MLGKTAKQGKAKKLAIYKAFRSGNRYHHKSFELKGGRFQPGNLIFVAKMNVWKYIQFQSVIVNNGMNYTQFHITVKLQSAINVVCILNWLFFLLRLIFSYLVSINLDHLVFKKFLLREGNLMARKDFARFLLKNLMRSTV